MESVYDLHQHTHCVIMHIGKTKIITCINSTSNRRFDPFDLDEVKLDSSIFYNKQKTDVTGAGGGFKGYDDIVIDNFRDRLYNLFKKDKETWDEEDYFFVKAVSDYLPAAIKKTIKIMKVEIESFDLFHYAFVVPSEWEEEIRDGIIRPIFVQSGLISNEDHQDRLLFFTDIESICYKCSFERGQNTILCRVLHEEKKVMIKLDLIQTTTTLFNFPNAKLFPKVMSSSSVSVTTDKIIGGKRNAFRKLMPRPVVTTDKIPDGLRNRRNALTELMPSPVVTADEIPGGKRNALRKLILRSLANKHYEYREDPIERFKRASFHSMDKENEEKGPEKKTGIFKTELMKEFINVGDPSINAEISTLLLGCMKDIISDNFTKSYRFLLVTDNYSDWDFESKNDIAWLEYILESNRSSLNSNITITSTNPREEIIDPWFILLGACIGVFEAIQNSDINCKPHIVSSVDLTTSSSVFLNSKPDAIINLDISLGSTLFTCSLLDEDGSIQQIFDHDYFIKDKHLPPLGHFYTFSNTTTLNVKQQFIPFAERYLLGDYRDFTLEDNAFLKKYILLEMKAFLANDFSYGEVLISTDKQKYIKAFILMYMIYIKEEILYKLPEQLISDQMEMKIGYAVSIDAILLNNTIESKDNLRDIIYASGLVPKDDHSKKLRITTQGERVLTAIQKSLKLELSLKSYFLICQLHEDYVQLSLHQVVTAPSPEEKEQESIIVQDEIIAIQNIYDSLCSNMWYTLLQDSSLIELCEMHNTSDNNKVIDLFSSESKAEFFINLKGHISDNVLQNNPDIRNTNAVNLTRSCNCKVRLVISDVIDISFTPVLQDIARTLSASLLNKELFGNYINVDYLFSIIHFNNNPRLQYAFSRILEEEADDFNLELGIDTSCLVVPELFSQLLQPVISQRPFCYKDFEIGALQQVCSENYIGCINLPKFDDTRRIYKSKLTDLETIKCNDHIAFPFLNKGDVIQHNVRSERKFYLKAFTRQDVDFFHLSVNSAKTMNCLENNEMFYFNRNIHKTVGNAHAYFVNYCSRDALYVPVMISVSYVSYTSSFQFSIKLVGADTRNKKLMGVLEIGEPLTLTRF